MPRLAQFIDDDRSRIGRLIDAIERGENPDLERVLALQALDVARAGELFVLDTHERGVAADDRFAEQLGY